MGSLRPGQKTVSATISQPTAIIALLAIALLAASIQRIYPSITYEAVRKSGPIQLDEVTMSRLYYSEEGRVTPSLCEELTQFRRVRKHLVLPATAEVAQVFILARSYPGNDSPLHLAINDIEVAAIEPVQRIGQTSGLIGSLRSPGGRGQARSGVLGVSRKRHGPMFGCRRRASTSAARSAPGRNGGDWPSRTQRCVLAA